MRTYNHRYNDYTIAELPWTRLIAAFCRLLQILRDILERIVRRCTTGKRFLFVMHFIIPQNNSSDNPVGSWQLHWPWERENAISWNNDAQDNFGRGHNDIVGDVCRMGVAGALRASIDRGERCAQRSVRAAAGRGTSDRHLGLCRPGHGEGCAE